MNRLHPAAFALTAALMAAGTQTFAQEAPVPSRPRTAPAAPPVGEAAPVPQPQNPVAYYGTQNFREVQQQLREIMFRYPPGVRTVFQADPTLLQRQDYMATYPELQAFLQSHPEVIRNPSFFFGEPSSETERTPRDRALDMVRRTIDGIGFLTGFLTVVVLVYSLLRQALEYRRWRRQIQIQTDVHTKLLDRMTNNQELIAYIETSAGRRFLEAPMPLSLPSPAGPGMLAPVSRIIWSVQIGVVILALGIGFLIARTTIDDVDLSGVFEVLGSLAMAVGVGFVASALLSWALSLKMGLINAPPKVEA
jgi:hypothetical protein